jgi:hypothetical protein
MFAIESADDLRLIGEIAAGRLRLFMDRTTTFR